MEKIDYSEYKCSGCSDGWDLESEINGKCQGCGCPTVDGRAAFGCYWSPVICDVCGYAPCDQSC